MLDNQFWYFVVTGFLAQLVDGTLGMAYGVISTSLLLSLGVLPAAASATVHMAECFTTGASAASHHAFGNVDRALFRRLLIPGVVGAILGAYVLTSLPGETIKPYVSIYLLIMGVVIVFKAFRHVQGRRVVTRLGPLGFCGAFVDTIGGGGWGPIVASTLVARGNGVRNSVGTVNAVEFFVTLAASLTFIVTIGVSHWQIVLGLVTGGLLAAPIGAYACNRIPVRPFMFAVGILLVTLSIRTLSGTFFA